MLKENLYCTGQNEKIRGNKDRDSHKKQKLLRNKGLLSTTEYKRFNGKQSSHLLIIWSEL